MKYLALNDQPFKISLSKLTNSNLVVLSYELTTSTFLSLYVCSPTFLAHCAYAFMHFDHSSCNLDSSCTSHLLLDSNTRLAISSLYLWESVICHGRGMMFWYQLIRTRNTNTQKSTDLLGEFVFNWKYNDVNPYIMLPSKLIIISL